MSSRVKRGLLMALLLVSALLIAGNVLAQGGEDGDVITDDQVNAVSKELYCPVCENVPLDVCGTAACERWREQVRTLLEEGKSEDEVIDYFVLQFGERVVGTPQDPLLALFSWIVPLASVVLGIGVTGYVFLRWRHNHEDEASSHVVDDDDVAYDDDYRSRLENELRE